MFQIPSILLDNGRNLKSCCILVQTEKKSRHFDDEKYFASVCCLPALFYNNLEFCHEISTKTCRSFVKPTSCSSVVYCIQFKPKKKFVKPQRQHKTKVFLKSKLAIRYLLVKIFNRILKPTVIIARSHEEKQSEN